MKKILANAQFFGFAPSSLMLATLDALQKQYPQQYEITLISNTHIAALTSTRAHMPYNLLDLGDTPLLDFLFASTAHTTYDAFISFYDPTLMLYAWFYDMPRTLYDGLFHFWDDQSFQAQIISDVDRATEHKRARDVGRIREWHDALWVKNPHEMLFCAHFFADLQFVRKAPDLESRLSQYPELKKKIIQVDSIVNAKRRAPLPFQQRDMILVSLGGSLNPIVTFEQNIFYAKTVIKFIKEMLPRLSPRPARCCVVLHPLIHQRLQTDLPDYEGIDIVSSVAQDTYFSWLQKSIVAYVPPSYTTLQECAYFETPVFLLPEQNGGQPHCYKLLRDHGYSTQHNMTVVGQLGREYGEFDVVSMYADIAHLYDQKKLRQDILEQIEAFYQLATNVDSRTTLLNTQQRAIHRMMGGFDGVEQVTGAIHTYLQTS